MSIFIQLGAGAGDQDYSANFRDGFSSYVKRKRMADNDKIILVEANHFNLSTLTTAWQGFPCAVIYHLAILSDDQKAPSEIEFFYAEEDAPFFQVSSVKKEHVQKFYPGAKILNFLVKAMGINEFLRQECGNRPIELLAIDIEGLDVLVMQNLDLSVFDIHIISFEKSHRNFQDDSLSRKLKSFGYRQGGSGMDPHNSDALWVKPNSFYEMMYFSVRHYRHRFWEIQIPLRHYLKFKIFKRV
jgi:hypothetical protein